MWVSELKPRSSETGNMEFGNLGSETRNVEFGNEKREIRQLWFKK